MSGRSKQEDVVYISIEITRYVVDDSPGWVDCRLVDIDGREHLFHEKIPVVTAASVWSDTEFPQPGVIAGVVVERRVRSDGREALVVDTKQPWDVQSLAGGTQFEVGPEQLAPEP